MPSSADIGNATVNPVLLLINHFEVGNGGVQFGIPVDQAFAAINQAVFMQTHEDFFHGIRISRRPW